uniref:Lupus La protein n=1 Tax=Panagrellus redivivus TaxID=6233 RepID=A0A7E4VJ83_PANRE
MTTETAPELSAKILAQLEYYFGNVNLQRDRFLQDEMKKDHGWVPIDVLLTFNRLKQITTDKKVIAAALANSEVVDVHEDGEKVRRNPDVPLPENSLEFWQEIKSRTAYVKGFEPTTTLDEIVEFLKPFGNVQNVVMRKTKVTKLFKGSIFATFDDVETAQKFVNSEDAKTWNEKELIRMMQNDYWAKEVAETKERRAAEKNLKQQKKLETIAQSEEAINAVNFVKGQVIKVTGLPTEGVSFALVREFFEKFAPVAYVVREDQSSEAQIRFEGLEENAAVAALEKIKEAGEPLKFQDNEITVSLLEGDEEEKYWADFTKNKAAQIDRNKNRRGGRGGRGGRGNKRAHGGGRGVRNDAKRSKAGA